MLVIHNFKEAFALYQNGRIPFNLLQEQTAIFSLEENGIVDSSKVTLEDIDRLLISEIVDEDYDSYFGGNIYICEELEDLGLIEGCDFDFAESHSGRWPNLLDMPLGGDSCVHIQGEPKFIMFLLCWNDAGGPMYYIPESLWTDNVKLSVMQTEKFWKSEGTNDSDTMVL